MADFCEWRTGGKSPTGMSVYLCVCVCVNLWRWMQCFADPWNLPHYLAHCAILLPWPLSHPVTQPPPLPPAWPAHSCPFSPLWGTWNPGPCSEQGERAAPALCFPCRSSHARQGTSFLMSPKPAWPNPPGHTTRRACWEGAFIKQSLMVR